MAGLAGPSVASPLLPLISRFYRSPLVSCRRWRSSSIRAGMSGVSFSRGAVRFLR